jgi:tRNA (cmo5U34)-methyltransferase
MSAREEEGMLGQSPTGSEEQVRAGHHWKEADRVASYVEQNDQDPEHVGEAFEMLTRVLPFEKDAAIRVLDIGSGHGVLAAVVLDAFPNATAIGLDVSQAMMEVGRERMARFGSRFDYVEGDFADGHLPDAVPGPFDLVVSSRAIHHITPDAKRTLFADVYQRLAPGGCFMDLDNMRPRDDFLRARYAQVDAPFRGYGRAQQQPRPAGASREHPDPVAEQLESLRAAGFAHADCFWKRLGRSLIGGFKEA